MSGKNKNYNSIIFLTTLSVYLGISLLGATPQVLAYAATTRNFDIQTEIEITDEFDNNPEKESGSSAEAFTNTPEHLFFERCADCLSSFLKSNRFPAVANVDVAAASPENFFPASKFEFQQSPGGFKIDKTDFFGKLKFQPELSSETPAADTRFDSKLKRPPLTARNTVININYDGRIISSENNQIFTVTHLPRAAIDHTA